MNWLVFRVEFAGVRSWSGIGAHSAKKDWLVVGFGIAGIVGGDRNETAEEYDGNKALRAA